MQSIDGWGVWFRLLAETQRAAAVPPTRTFGPTYPSRGEALFEIYSAAASPGRSNCSAASRA